MEARAHGQPFPPCSPALRRLPPCPTGTSCSPGHMVRAAGTRLRPGAGPAGEGRLSGRKTSSPGHSNLRVLLYKRNLRTQYKDILFKIYFSGSKSENSFLAQFSPALRWSLRSRC